MATINSTTTKDRPLRFAALIRVSTEKQEKRGESLRTQEKQIRDAVERMGGKVAKQYAGQEHATAGWERQQLDRLLTDAQKTPRPFDSVIVSHPDRWSRDNVASQTGLDCLKENGIRFFVLGAEQDLFDPTVEMYLAMSAVIGKFQASTQSGKSIENRIERAKRGWPTCGKLPYGRTWDRDKAAWGIDAEVQAMLNDVAARYLAGESMAELAKLYGINHSFLHKTLTAGCGTVWEQRFRMPKMRIDETVQTIVPALLEPAIIAAVKRRAEANKTFSHGSLKHEYLFSRMVFCGECGYAMGGETNPRGKRYYRHDSRNGSASCPLPFRPWVPADLLEEKILEHLADLWGNPAAVEKAMADAEPNKAEAEKARKRLGRIDADLEKVKTGRQRIIGFIGKGTIEEADAEGQLNDLREREIKLSEEADKLRAVLTETLTEEDRKRLAKRVVSARRWVAMRDAERPETMTYEQKRMLIEDVFGGKLPDGRRMGVYVTPIDLERGTKGRRWQYEIRGRIQAEGIVGREAGTSSSRH